MTYLRTERLTLRRFTSADVDNLVDLDSDPQVMRFLTNSRPPARSVIENEVLPGLLRQYEEHPGLGCWAAVETASGHFLGWFELTPSTDGASDEAELGYRLKRVAWGRGLATEGSRALVRAAFRDLGLRRVYAHTMAVNLRSRRVMEKAGLRHARTFHPTFDDPIPGTELGEVEYELLRDTWLASEESPDRELAGQEGEER